MQMLPCILVCVLAVVHAVEQEVDFVYQGFGNGIIVRDNATYNASALRVNLDGVRYLRNQMFNITKEDITLGNGNDEKDLISFFWANISQSLGVEYQQISSKSVFGKYAVTWYYQILWKLRRVYSWLVNVIATKVPVILEFVEDTFKSKKECPEGDWEIDLNYNGIRTTFFLSIAGYTSGNDVCDTTARESAVMYITQLELNNVLNGHYSEWCRLISTGGKWHGNSLLTLYPDGGPKQVWELPCSDDQT